MNEEKPVIHKKDMLEAKKQAEVLNDERDNTIKGLEAKVEERDKKIEFLEDEVSDLNDIITDLETGIRVQARLLAL